MLSSFAQAVLLLGHFLAFGGELNLFRGDGVEYVEVMLENGGDSLRASSGPMRPSVKISRMSLS